jgi:hypothetical protein
VKKVEMSEAVAHMEEMRDGNKIFVGSPERKTLPRRPKNPVTVCCEHGNELPVSIKRGEFLDYLSDCQLLKNGFAPWYLVTHS